ncbi:MAG: hypothetical protein V3T30_02260 [Thermodesulfobacteriota bacterium]
MKVSAKMVVAGSVFRCPICGAEVSVMRRGKSAPGPHCCNEPMELIEEINAIYRCPVCKSEIMVIAEMSKSLNSKCCNRKMIKAN